MPCPPGHTIYHAMFTQVITYHRPQYNMPYLHFRKKKNRLFDLIQCPRVSALIPAHLTYQKREKTKVKVENKSKMLYLKHDPKWSKMLYMQPKRLVYPVILSQMHFVWNEMEGEFLWSIL